jgi:hypothetical protein
VLLAGEEEATIQAQVHDYCHEGECLALGVRLLLRIQLLREHHCQSAPPFAAFLAADVCVTLTLV